MEQQISISRNIIKYILDNIPTLRINNAQKCVELIEQNYIISDRDYLIFKILFSEIDKLPYDPQKEQSKVLIAELIMNWRTSRSIKTNINISNSNNYEIDLAFYHNKDKIYFDPIITKEERNKLLVQYSNKVEIHDVKSFINPEHHNKLKNLPTEIKLQRNKAYNLGKILHPFLRYENKLIFYDPYIRNSYRSLNNLLKILKVCKNGVNILIKTRPDRLEDPVKLAEFNTSVKNYSIIFEYYKTKEIKVKKIEITGHKERYIETDRFYIYIPGGLDQFDDEGKYNFSDDNEIAHLRIERKT